MWRISVALITVLALCSGCVNTQILKQCPYPPQKWTDHAPFCGEPRDSGKYDDESAWWLNQGVKPL